jgi:hypothetical protein
MPQITMDITDEQLTRIKTATGLSTAAEVKTWAIGALKNAVREEEASKIEASENAILDVATKAKEDAIRDALSAPLVEIT